MIFKRKTSPKKIWSILLAVSLLTALWNFGTFAQDDTSDTIVVYVGAEDTAARIAGTTPVVSEAKGIILPLKAVEISKDATAEDAIKQVLDAAFPNNYNIVSGSYGDYITSINGLNSGENGDKTGQWGDTSGWCYMVNGKDASTSISNCTLSDQDVIQLYYSCAGYADNRTAANYEKIQVTVEVEDSAARIAGTTPVVPEAKGVLVTDTAIELSKGANALEAIQSVLQNQLKGQFHIAPNTYGAYLTDISDIRMGENGDKTGQWGDASGWLYLINGVPASVGMEAYTLKDGDRIQVAYSCTGMGDDIGTVISTSQPTATPEVTVKPDITDNTSLNPSLEQQVKLLSQAKTAEKLISDYIYQNLLQNGEYVPAFGEDGEYAIFTLARSNYPVKDGYYDSYYNGIATALKELNTNGKVCISAEQNKWKTIDDMQITEWAKLAMAVTAIGKDATNVGGINLIAKLAEKNTLDNKSEWLKYPTALLALITGEYTLPQGDAYYTKDELALKVAESIPDAIASGYSDTVAMTLQPLAPFYQKDAATGTASAIIKEKVDLALQFLENKQLETGYFNDWDTTNNPWSTSQIMMVLGQYGINPLNEDQGYDFIKNGKTVLDTMFEYINFETGSLDSYFVSYDPIQYVRGLDSIIRYLDGKVGLFDCTDIQSTVKAPNTEPPIDTASPAIQSVSSGTVQNEAVSIISPTETSTASLPNNSNSSKTGDTTPVAIFVVIAICAATTGALTYRKHKKEYK